VKKGRLLSDGAGDRAGQGKSRAYSLTRYGSKEAAFLVRSLCRDSIERAFTGVDRHAVSMVRGGPSSTLEGSRLAWQIVARGGAGSFGGLVVGKGDAREPPAFWL